MNDNFVSRKDRIVASAIEIISDLGLTALTTKNLAHKENMSEGLLYKYFGGIDDVLAEVVDYYCKFDKGIRQTVLSKDGSYVEKIMDYFVAYATYYDNYYAISTLMLQYEELLHNVNTREKIAWCISERMSFIEELFKNAIDNNEIIDTIMPHELAVSVTGITMAHILDRRIAYRRQSFKNELLLNLRKWLDIIKVEE